MSSGEFQTARKQSPEKPAEPNSTPDGQEASGFNNPEFGTIQQAGVHRFLFTLIGIIVAAAILSYSIRWHSTDTPSSKLFSGNNQFGELAAIVAVVAGISVAVASFTWPPLLRVKKEVGATTFRWALGAYAVIGAVAVIGPFLVEGSGNTSFELSYFNFRIGLIAILILGA